MNKNDPAPASCGVQSLVGQKHGLYLDMMKWVRWLGFGEMSVFQAERSLWTQDTKWLQAEYWKEGSPFGGEESSGIMQERMSDWIRAFGQSLEELDSPLPKSWQMCDRHIGDSEVVSEKKAWDDRFDLAGKRDGDWRCERRENAVQKTEVKHTQTWTWVVATWWVIWEGAGRYYGEKTMGVLIPRYRCWNQERQGSRNCGCSQIVILLLSGHKDNALF